MIFYSWTALNGRNPQARESPVAIGISDDRGRAMRAGEELLGSGQALTVIIEAVRLAMAAATLAPCYARTGVGWLGRRTGTGEVAWHRFFARDEPADPTAPGETPPGETPPGETPAGQTPAGQTPAGQTLPGETPPGSDVCRTDEPRPVPGN
jgi:hypothetical protein